MRLGRRMLSFALLTLATTLPAAPSPAAPRAMAFVTPTPLILPGVRGRVRLVGKPPPPRPINKYFDPKCPKSAQQDTVVLVDADGHLKDVVIRIAPGQLRGETPHEVLSVRHEGCRFVPRVLALMTEQEVEFRNDDPTLHNVRAWDPSGINFNFVLPVGSAPIRKIISSKPATVRVTCDMHYPQAAYAVITDHPYFAVTAADGTYRIPRVPPGLYKLEAVHAWYGIKSQEIAVDVLRGAQADFAYEGTP